MRILNYYYHDVEDTKWDFSSLEFNKISLFVGNSATGKTRILNTIFNLGVFVSRSEFKSGAWELTFEHDEKIYTWHLTAYKEKGEPNRNDKSEITKDYLWIHEGDERIPLIQRDSFQFIFNGNQTLPKLSSQETGISLLKEEEIIQPIFQGFGQIMRRSFSDNALTKISNIHAIPLKLLKNLKDKKSKDDIFAANLNLSANLFLLKEYFNKDYKSITATFKSVFPFINKFNFTELSNLHKHTQLAVNVPVFQIQENNSENWIPITELSSGMKKVLLILTDLHITPRNSIYIVDEYENSLGLNAIDFLPEFLFSSEPEIQFFITSHHPYLINRIPLNYWYIFHRDQMQVHIKYGDEIVKRYGKSKQQAFINLINDPFFKNGVNTK